MAGDSARRSLGGSAEIVTMRQPGAVNSGIAPRRHPGMGLHRRGGTVRQRALLISAVTGLVVASATLTACSSSGGASVSSSAPPAAARAPVGAGAADNAAVPAASAPVNGPAVAGPAQGAASSGAVFGPAQPPHAGSGTSQSSTSAKLVPASQSIVYTAQLTVRANDVNAALAKATGIVEAAGGYISSENATSNPSQEADSTATIELKIPVAAYQQAIATLSGGSLGTQLSLQQQAQDVTQQVADINSQVTSDEAAIAQLRALLKDAGSVGDLLNVQNQINQEESQLEAMEAQQRALDHETAYATVDITIVGPKAAAPKPQPKKPVPPPGLASGASGGWHAFKLTVDWLLAIIGAIAPFAAGLAVLAAIALYIRRRLVRKPSEREAEADTTVSLGKNQARSATS